MPQRSVVASDEPLYFLPASLPPLTGAEKILLFRLLNEKQIPFPGIGNRMAFWVHVTKILSERLGLEKDIGAVSDAVTRGVAQQKSSLLIGNGNTRGELGMLIESWIAFTDKHQAESKRSKGRDNEEMWKAHNENERVGKE
jgi:hypothetical protein